MDEVETQGGKSVGDEACDGGRLKRRDVPANHTIRQQESSHREGTRTITHCHLFIIDNIVIM